MQIRTDLALEQREIVGDIPNGVSYNEETENGIKITRIIIENEQGEKALSKPKGKYITVEIPSLEFRAQNEKEIKKLSLEIEKLISKNGDALILGLGNKNITPDSLGPLACEKILATRHIKDQLRESVGIEAARSVSVIAPGVLGQTGIESFDIIKGVADRVKPDFIIAIDALASRKLERLGKTVQIADNGISPGAGVGNKRSEISEKTLGIPVIALGVPTVVDCETLVYDLTDNDNIKGQENQKNMIVTPREIDILIQRAAALISSAINMALQKEIDQSIIREIMS